MNPESLHKCLSRLLPHLDDMQIALTGGVAIRLHVDEVRSDRIPAFAAEDVDFVAGSVHAIHPTVTGDFLVSHYHLPHPGYAKFLVQLVDPASRLRLDFFPDTQRALSRAPVVDIGGVPIRMLGAEDILNHKIQLLSGAFAGSHVEEKHYADAKRLGARCGREVPTIPASQLVSTVYSQDLEEMCSRCETSRSAAFPLAPKAAIFDVLGYV